MAKPAGKVAPKVAAKATPVAVPASVPASQPVVVVAKVADPDDLPGIMATIRGALQTNNWRALVLAVLVGLVWLARRVGKQWVPWLGTSKGGAFLVSVGAGLVVICNGCASGRWSWQLVADGVMLAVSTSGLWSLGKASLEGTPTTPAPAIPAASEPPAAPASNTP